MLEAAFEIHKYGFYFFNMLTMVSAEQKYKEWNSYEKVSPLQKCIKTANKTHNNFALFYFAFLFKTVRNEARKMSCTIDEGRRERHFVEMLKKFNKNIFY